MDFNHFLDYLCNKQRAYDVLDYENCDWKLVREKMWPELSGLDPDDFYNRFLKYDTPWSESTVIYPNRAKWQTICLHVIRTYGVAKYLQPRLTINNKLNGIHFDYSPVAGEERAWFKQLVVNQSKQFQSPKFILKFENVYKITRKTAPTAAHPHGKPIRLRFAEHSPPAFGQVRLLFHGTRLTNVLDILKHGLQCPGQQFSDSGSDYESVPKYGKGLYFTDWCSNAAIYCSNNRQHGAGDGHKQAIMVAIVDLGSNWKRCTPNKETGEGMRAGAWQGESARIVSGACYPTNSAAFPFEPEREYAVIASNGGAAKKLGLMAVEQATEYILPCDKAERAELLYILLVQQEKAETVGYMDTPEFSEQAPVLDDDDEQEEAGF